MIESTLLAWTNLLVLILLASISGSLVSSWLPWTDEARCCHVDRAFGVTLAPFLAGIIVILVMQLLPGASHTVHKYTVFSILFGGAVFFFATKKSSVSVKAEKVALSGTELYFLVLLLLWGAMLLANAVFLPLTQNDPLEYAMVGREIFLTRSLETYPLLNPETNASGFFAPWTHPPLYVSLIYLVSALQGHADAPGLMRLISPWFLLAATYAIVVLGRLHSPNTGWLSGILFISTPLLFLGTDSGLIDALPVSGMVLLILVLVGSLHNVPAYPLALGVVLGLVLWTHSQAVLFLPLVGVALCVQQGMLHWRSAVGMMLMTYALALLVGGAPYVKNYLLFGSAISDHPQVFAMPELDWQGYFSYARGLDHWVAKIQYGVFKGWFSLEAFGWLFWLWAAGCAVFFLRQGVQRLSQIFQRGLDETGRHFAVLWIGFILVLTYLGGVIVSIAMGIDLMIRNERYMLIIVPVLALGGAYFLVALGSGMWKRAHSPTAGNVVKATIFASYFLLANLLLLQAATVGWYYRWRNVEPKPIASAFHEELTVTQGRDLKHLDWILNQWPSFNAVLEMSRRIPEEALVLAMRPADMYYAKRKMISYLDPRLMPFYREQDPETAAGMLKSLGIRYILMSDYSLPPAYGSSLLTLLADPRLSRLVYSSGMTQLYALEPDGQMAADAVDVTPGQYPWTRTLQMRIGGRKVLDVVGFEQQVFGGGESTSTVPAFHRDYSVMLASGHAGGLGSNMGRRSTFIKAEPGEYVVRTNLKGEGFITLWLAQFDANNTEVVQPTLDRNRPLRLGDLSLSVQNPRIEFVRRFKVDPATRFIRIGVEHVGKSRVVIENMMLVKLVAKSPAGS